MKVIFIGLVFFCTMTSGAKKNRPPKTEQYWVPPRLLTSVPQTPSAAPAAELLALQRVIQSENQRLNKDPYLLQAISHPSPQVSKAAILALGRIGDPYAIEALSRILNGKSLEKKEWAAFSLGLIGDELAIKLLSQHLTMEKSSKVRSSYYRALGYSRNSLVLPVLVKALSSEKDLSAQKNIVEGLGILLSGDSASWEISEDLLGPITRIATSDNNSSLAAAFVLAQFKGNPKNLPVANILSAVSKNLPSTNQALLIRSLSRSDNPQLIPLFLSHLDPKFPLSVRIEAMKALKGKPLSETSGGALARSLNSPESSLVITTLDTVVFKPEQFSWLKTPLELLLKTTKSDWVKGKTLKTLCTVAPDIGQKYVQEFLKNKGLLGLPPVLSSLVILRTSENIKQLIPFLTEGNPLLLSDAIEQMANLEEDDFPDDWKTALKELVMKKDPGLLALISELAKQMNWKDFGKPLAEAYPSLNSDDTTETKSTLLNSLATLGSDSDLPLLQSALNDNAKQVVVAAAQAIKNISGRDPKIPLPINSRITESTPSWNQLKSVISQRIFIKTTRGDIELKLFDDTPLTGYRFVEFIKKKFYDGKTFHRVVPNFVSQGGDPRGDGFGGPGFLIRDEVSPRNHERGTVGIATAGKDTGGCQFFFNLSSNYHLNGRYTAFAEVVSGMDVVEKLEVGDKIISATLK
ncbi:MAG: peptidylprolyl isomerase [Deltaproteobacteria bacterium]